MSSEVDLCASTVTVISLIPNMMLRTQVAEGVKGLGAQHRSARSREDLFQILAESPGADHSAVIVFDLNAQNLDPVSIIKELKARSTPPAIAAFFSHINGEDEQAALDVGADLVLPRSKFFSRVADLLTIRKG